MSVNPTLVIVGGRRRDGALSPVVARDGVIVDDSEADLSTRSTTIDADGLTVSPGFIDVQINGGHGFDLASDPEAMWELGRVLPRHGVTAFLPTIISSPAAITDQALTALRRRPADHRGAEPLGLHFEGPMLNLGRVGAHDPHNLIAPDPEAVGRWTRSNGVMLVTLAPELPGAIPIIDRLRSAGVIVSAGHSLATAAEAEAGFAGGVTMVTHLFNAMGSLNHRAPGLAGVALADDRAVVGLIADGVHVDPVMVTVAWRAKGPGQVVLVTDAVAPMGLGPGRFELGGQVITADETSVRTADGVLAGSVLTMDQAVANLMAFTGCSLSDAAAAASTTPAMAVGATGRGHLHQGAVADVVLLEADASVAVTICRGEVAYVAADHHDRLSNDRLLEGEG